MNGFYVLVLAATIVGAVVLIPRAIAHDRRIEADPGLIERAKRW